jgi:CheY-like chemotaxis protein
VKVLVVEDNPVNQKVILVLLKKLGCQVDVAENGRVALEKMDEHDFDIIFMDCQMPELDGYAATQEIRRREGGEKHNIVVAMTANAMQGDREKCLNSGMNDYIPKPIKRDLVEEMITKYCGKALQPAES